MVGESPHTTLRIVSLTNYLKSVLSLIIIVIGRLDKDLFVRYHLKSSLEKTQHTLDDQK